jgi:hypothetical protein
MRMRMRMLHIRNMHQMHRRRSAHCMRTIPRGRALSRLPPGFCPTRTTPTTSHYLQLPLPHTLLSLALHPACQLDRGSVRHHQLSRTRNGRQCGCGSCLVRAMPPARTCSSHALAESLRCKRSRDRSFEDPPDRREFPLAAAPTTFARSSDLSSYVHRPYPPLTPAQMRTYLTSASPNVATATERRLSSGRPCVRAWTQQASTASQTPRSLIFSLAFAAASRINVITFCLHVTTRRSPTKAPLTRLKFPKTEYAASRPCNLILCRKIRMHSR